MTRTGLITLAALAWVAAAPALAADPVFAKFDKICLATSGVGDAAKAAATDDGFGPASADQLAALQKSLNLSGAEIMAKSEGDRLEAVFWGKRQVQLGGKPFTSRVCTFFIDAPEPAAIAAANAWAAVTPLPSDNPKAPPVLMFAGGPGHHVAVASMPQDKQAEALGKGQVQILMAGQSDAGHTMFVYSAIEASQPAP